MKFSVQENLVPGKTYDQKFSLLKEIGYDAVELWGTDDMPNKIKEVKELSASYGIRISTVCSGYKGDLLSASPKERETAVAEITDRLNWAANLEAVGVIVVPTFGGSKLPDLSPYATATELERRLLLEELKQLSRRAQDVGSHVILEPLNRYETHLVRTLSDAYSIALEAGEGIGVMGDIFHMNIEEADMARALSAAFPRLLHLHLADSNRMEPGKGHTDFSTPLKALSKLGYSYYGALECSLSHEPRKSLEEALAFLRLQQK
ncbi:MAG: sugar phosphate isomerase/epimerase family protein [Thermoprotei archaeon]